MESMPASASADTVDSYLVDGKKIENFDGTQLQGKWIARYSIGRVAGKAERVHVITTSLEDLGKTVKIMSVEGMKKAVNPLCVIEGKVVSPEELKALDVDKILHMTVLKDDSAVKKYGEAARGGAIVVETKK